MTRDLQLEEETLDALTAVPGLTTRPMFGGLGIMRNGNLLAGVRAGRLMLRLGPEAASDALALDGVTPMVHGDRAMRGYVFVDTEAVDDATRARLILGAILFSETLPPKPAKPARKRGK